MPFTYQSYNAKSLSIKHENGGKEHPAHKELVALFQARWYGAQQHWLVPKVYELKVRDWIKKRDKEEEKRKVESKEKERKENGREKEPTKPNKEPNAVVEEDKEDKLAIIQSHVKSRKDQKKYHRSISSGDGDEEEVIQVARNIKSNRKTHPADLETFAKKYTIEPEIKSSENSSSSCESSDGSPVPSIASTRYTHQTHETHRPDRKSTHHVYPPPSHHYPLQQTYYPAHPSQYAMPQTVAQSIPYSVPYSVPRSVSQSTYYYNRENDREPTEVHSKKVTPMDQPKKKKSTKKSKQIKELTKQVQDLQNLILSKLK